MFKAATRSSLRAIPTPDVSLSSALALPSVFVRHAYKSFGDKEVLHDISLSVARGEVVSIIGPSGAGKSTLLRCLTLLETFDAGQLSYDSLTVCQPQWGKNAPEQDKASGATEAAAEAAGAGAHTVPTCTYDREAMRRARMRFGIVFQNYNLFPHMTVLQNVCDAPIVVQGRNKDEVEQQARELLDQLGLSEHVDKVPDQLSGGQQQRVAIARALCMKPRVMYFDEATSALDPRLTRDMVALIHNMVEQYNMTVVIVTHEMDFARAVSDRILLILDGCIVEEGTPEEVLDHPSDARTRAFLAHAEEDESL